MQKTDLISKRENTNTNYWCWDLDYVKKYKKWELIKYLTNSKFITELEAQKKGTIVVWEDIDRLVKDADINNRDNHKNFLNAGDHVKKHLAMVFHRYIENGKLKLFYNSIGAIKTYLHTVYPMESHIFNYVVEYNTSFKITITSSKEYDLSGLKVSFIKTTERNFSTKV